MLLEIGAAPPAKLPHALGLGMARTAEKACKEPGMDELAEIRYNVNAWRDNSHQTINRFVFPIFGNVRVRCSD